MTIPEIRALREELEVALRQAFSDFQRVSGLAVVAVDVSTYCSTHLETSKVTVILETI